MDAIPVPRPKRSAHNPGRLVSSLLQTQMRHLHDAERNLPLKYRSAIYINAIQTEGEAAAYIQHVTEAIHKAHNDAEKQRAKRKGGIAIAAAAERPARKKTAARKTKPKKTAAKKKSRPRKK